MSEKDRIDWNDDKELDSNTVEQEDFDDFEDPIDGFADFDDLSDTEDLSKMDAPDSGASSAEKGAKSKATDGAKNGSAGKTPADQTVAPAVLKTKRRRGISAAGLGILFTVSILVSGVGVGGAILLAEGVRLRSLWQPENILQVDQLLNFSDHPLNILYMVTMGIVFLAGLGGYLMSRVARKANRRMQDAEVMLDHLTALSMDKQEGWQSKKFKEFAPAEAFVVRTLGAWRLQEARQKRLMGVEGELHRLEKALKKNSREDLTGHFDYPAVGRLADEMTRYFDARDLARGKLNEVEGQNHENSKEILDLLQESRQWNGVTLDNLGIHCAALDDLAGQMDNLARHLETSTAEAGSKDGMTDIIEGIRRDLDGHIANSHVNGQSNSELNDLVDRGSKLAFQIAMEVARLGPRGERLLPMSQSLEELATGFRKLADGVTSEDLDAGASPAFRSIHKKLETLAVLITDDAQVHMRDLADEVPGFGTAASRISAKITRMVDGFNEQEDRLVRMGSSFADMTGALFDPSSAPVKESIEEPAVEPAVEPDDSLSIVRTTSLGEQPPDPDFSSSVTPGLETQASVLSPKAEKPEPVPDKTDKFSLDSEDIGDTPLPEDEEKVYDLEDFGATPEIVPEAGKPQVQDTDKVYELSDFGAVPEAVEEDPAEDKVYELSDFGGTPVTEEATGTDGEEVHDLSDFGAMPLEQAVGSETEGVPDDELVYDLSDFSAKPMK